jgi:hypothetical protein
MFSAVFHPFLWRHNFLMFPVIHPTLFLCIRSMKELKYWNNVDACKLKTSRFILHLSHLNVPPYIYEHFQLTFIKIRFLCCDTLLLLFLCMKITDSSNDTMKEGQGFSLGTKVK